MYPLKFQKILKEKIWGGRNMAVQLGFLLPENILIGESWEVSTHKNGPSVIENGKYKGRKLTELLENEREKMLGREIACTYPDKFPILVKFLDINDRLSVQVHPDNDFALPREGEFGKAESWYVINASKDAEIIMGFNAGVSQEQFLSELRGNNLSAVFRKVKVKPGDIININPGTVHATTRGSVFICEVQQNSDLTYRVYDYDREFNDKKRELHLDKALEVLDYQAKLDLKSLTDRKPVFKAGAEQDLLVKNKYYCIERWLIKNEYYAGSYKNFTIYLVINGNGILMSGGKKYALNRGDTYFIPAQLDIRIKGKDLELIKIFL